MVDVFISYSRATRSKVEPIKHKLDELGLDCFFDMHQIDGGANFPDVIDRALRDSKAVLCCWSPLYFQGQWSMIECRDALARGIIVPVAVDHFEQFAPPADLRQINWFDLTDWTGEGEHEDWNRTLQNLGKLVGRDLCVTKEASAKHGRSSLLEDLRVTWEAFPAKSEIDAVERFLERVRGAVAGSGFEFEIEQHLDDLRRDAARRAKNAESAARERARQHAADEAARHEATAARQQPGAVWRDAIAGMPATTVPEMVTIPARGPTPDFAESGTSETGQAGGEHQAGQAPPAPPLALSKHPVTFAALDAAIAVGAGLEWPADDGQGRDQRSACNITWHDAAAYAAWLNGRLGLTGRADAYRLPSEAEWAHACHAGAAGANGENAFGLCFADGRLWEWCADSWHDDLAPAAQLAGGSSGQSNGVGERVIRGGSTGAAGVETSGSARMGFAPNESRKDIGFRLARSLSA